MTGSCLDTCQVCLAVSSLVLPSSARDKNTRKYLLHWIVVFYINSWKTKLTLQESCYFTTFTTRTYTSPASIYIIIEMCFFLI